MVDHKLKLVALFLSKFFSIAEGGGEVVIRVGSRYVQTRFDFHDILIDTLLYHS